MQVRGRWGHPGRRPRGQFTVPRGPRAAGASGVVSFGPLGVSRAGRSGLPPDSFRWLSGRTRVGSGALGGDRGVWSRAPLRDLWFFFHSKTTDIEAWLLQNVRDS